MEPDRSREFFCLLLHFSVRPGFRKSGLLLPFEATRELQGTHKYFREPNKLDRSPSTFLEYLTLWGFTRLASAKRTSYEPPQLGPVPANFGFSALPELFPARWWVCGGCANGILDRFPFLSYLFVEMFEFSNVYSKTFNNNSNL